MIRKTSVLGFFAVICFLLITLSVSADSSSYQEAEKEIRQKFEYLDNYMNQNQYGNSSWEEELKGLFKNTARAVGLFEMEWPQADTGTMWRYLHQRLQEIKLKTQNASNKILSDMPANNVFI